MKSSQTRGDTQNWLVAAGTVIEPGQLLAEDPLNVGYAIPVSTAALWINELSTRVLLAQRFIGIANGASVAGKADPIPVYTRGIATMNAASGYTPKPGDYVGLVKATGNNLLADTVGRSNNPMTTIGRVVETAASGNVVFEFDSDNQQNPGWDLQVATATDTPDGTKNLLLPADIHAPSIIQVASVQVTSTATAHADESLTIQAQLIPWGGGGAGSPVNVQTEALVLNTAAAQRAITTNMNLANAIRQAGDDSYQLNVNHVYVAGGSATPIAGLRISVSFYNVPNYAQAS
jgi:hypothetical protein